MGINIVKCTSIHNTSLKVGRKIEWIVLHYTAGTSSASGKAAAVARMFATSTREASADFIVDDANIVQYNGSIGSRYCWAVGGSKYTSMSTSEGGKYYGKCMNNNSISIEMCSSKKNTKSLSASDTDWYITDKTIANARELVLYLMKKYNIDKSHVIMHHHVTGKLCPQPWCLNEDALAGWNEFKKSLTSSSSKKKTYSGTFPTLPKKGYLAKGDKGVQVGRLQDFLTWYGTALKNDEDYGIMTESAVKAFQKANGLKADGLFGAKSLAKAKTIKK